MVVFAGANDLRSGSAPHPPRKRGPPSPEGEGKGCGADSPEMGMKQSASCRVVEDADPYVISLAEFARSAKKSSHFSGDMCGGKTPSGVVRMGLLHAAAALRRDGSVSAHPFFLSKSKPLL